MHAVFASSTTYCCPSSPGSSGYIWCWRWLLLECCSRSTMCSLCHQALSSSDIVAGSIAAQAPPPVCNRSCECGGSQHCHASDAACSRRTLEVYDFKKFSGLNLIQIVAINMTDLLGFILSSRPLCSTSTASSSSSTAIMGIMLRDPISSDCFSVFGKPSSTYLECQSIVFANTHNYVELDM